jgi:hypothetical protein
MTERTHKEIYDRLLAVETKVDNLVEDSKEVVAAFNAAQGAFTVLGWVASLAKPLLWIGGMIAAFGILYSEIKSGR